MRAARHSWWLDLNETLIRTGRVALSERLREQEALERLVELCASAGGDGGLQLVWLTGNTWEYARRIEEPLGLRLLPGVDWSVVSENGLLARDGAGRLLWRGAPLAGWAERVDEWLRRWGTGMRWALQSNEVRVTVKPLGNRFMPEELERWRQGLPELQGWTTAWLHPFYLDLDPTEVEVEGARVAGVDKAWAARRLLPSGARVVAVGDSGSDLPMLDLARSVGGKAWLVANADPALRADLSRTAHGYTEGVIEALRAG